MTYNLLTRSFPLGFNVTPGNLFNQSADSIIDVDAVRLQAIAARIIAMELGTLDAVIPTDLQQDFPWGKIFRTVVVAVVAGPIAAAGYVLATEPAVRRVGIVLAVFALLAALSGIIGNRADKGLDEILKMMQQPAPPPPPLIP